MLPYPENAYALVISVPLPGKHISLVICVFLEGEHISLGICVSQKGEHISLRICVSQVGQHISLGIWVSLVGEHISLGRCVSQEGEQISLGHMRFPGRATHITRDIDITSWLVSAYDFLFTSCEESQTNEWVCDSSQQVNKNRTSEPTMKLFILFEISFKQ